VGRFSWRPSFIFPPSSPLSPGTKKRPQPVNGWRPHGHVLSYLMCAAGASSGLSNIRQPNTRFPPRRSGAYFKILRWPNSAFHNRVATEEGLSVGMTAAPCCDLAPAVMTRHLADLGTNQTLSRGRFGLVEQIRCTAAPVLASVWYRRSFRKRGILSAGPSFWRRALPS